MIRFRTTRGVDFPVALTADIPADAREWRNDPEVRRWCRQYTLISESAHRAWLARIETDPTIKMFGIIDAVGSYTRGAKTPVGVCGLTSIDRVNQKAEFSLYIAPQYQGNGYGRQALVTLLAHGFLDMNLNRIWGESFEGNWAQEIFDKVGLRHEGALWDAYFRDGKFIKSHIWAMTREEFHARHLNRSGNRDESGGADRKPDPRVDPGADPGGAAKAADSDFDRGARAAIAVAREIGQGAGRGARIPPGCFALGGDVRE